MEYTKILDELLKYLSVTEHTQFAYIRNDANKKSEFLKDIDNSTLHSALLKLVKDDYVNTEMEDSIDPIFKSPRKDQYYKISFEGLVFINNGGYENLYYENQKQKSQFAELKKKQSLLEQKQVSNQFQIVLLTWIIAFGTIVAAVYYLFEILSFFGVLTSQKNV